MCCMHVVFVTVAFMRVMTVSILILVRILILVFFKMMLFTNTNKFKGLMTMADVKTKYYLGMRH